MSKGRVALIGLGMVAPAHAQSLLDLSDRVEVAAAFSPSPNTHLDVVRRCALAGKQVLLEKAVEISTARAEDLVAVCERAGVTLGVVLQHRFRQAGESLRAAIGDGELGRDEGCFTTIPLLRPQSYYEERVAARSSETVAAFCSRKASIRLT